MRLKLNGLSMALLALGVIPLPEPRRDACSCGGEGTCRWCFLNTSLGAQVEPSREPVRRDEREWAPGRVIVRTPEPQPCCQAWRGNSSSPCSCPACVAKLEAQAADNARRAEVCRAREASRIQQAAARKISAGKKAKRGWR